MTSILKVDTIQTTDGAAPTTKDLGFAAGTIIQTIQGTSQSMVTGISNNTYTDTGLTATITPKFSTSKILAFHSSAIIFANHQDVILRLVRGSTVVYNSNLYNTVTNSCSTGAFQFLDSPATTSSTIYKVQIYKNLGTIFYNYNNEVTSTSTLTLMEIAQ